MKLKEYINKVVSLQRGNNIEEAKQVLNEAISIYPNNNFLKKYEVFLLNKSGEHEKAFALANNLFDRLKNDAFFIQTYIYILEKRKDKKILKEFIDEFILNLPDFDENFFQFLKNVILRNFKGEEAKELIKKLPIKQVKEKNNYNTYKEKFKDFSVDAAINEIENLMMLPSYRDDFDLNMFLAGLYRKTKRFNEALEIYKKLISIKESIFLYKMLGYTYYNLKDFNNALFYLKEVFLKDPNDNILVQTIYKIFEQNKDYKAFKKLIEEVLASNPNAKKLFGYLKKAEKWQKN